MGTKVQRLGALIGIFAALLIASFMLAGCAGKGLQVDVETSGEGPNAAKRVKLRTDYQIENGFKMTRNTITGDYEIDLGSATTKDADPGMWLFLNTMLNLMKTVLLPGVPIAAPAPAAPTPPPDQDGG
jgi:hypothetical protein